MCRIYKSPPGFSNKWYPEGFQTAINYSLEKDTDIKIFYLPYFVATKWEAFKGRGTDYRTSTDFEDLVYVFESADDFEDQMKAAPQHLIVHDLSQRQLMPHWIYQLHPP